MGKKDLFTKSDKILWSIYERIYEKATPKADFNLLYENSDIDEDGRHQIPFLDYEIEEEVMLKIIDDTLKEYKIPKKSRGKYRLSIYLGCSPKIKQIKKEDQ